MERWLTALLVCQTLDVSVCTHSPASPPLRSCLCREQLISFDSCAEVLDLVLPVCWQPFNTEAQVQGCANQVWVGPGLGWGWEGGGRGGGGFGVQCHPLGTRREGVLPSG